MGAEKQANKIFFNDEAHFTIGGYVIKQNCHIWGSENPQAIEESPLHSEKVTVWCVFRSEGVIEPYFFENDDGTIVTVNLEHYGHMITDFSLSAIEEYGLEKMCGFNKTVPHAT